MTRRFTAQGSNTGFTCQHCGRDVPPLDNGSYRNHCPHCLWSLHLDIFPGDRANSCLGGLEPIAAEHSGKKGWIIVHKCQKCGQLRRNKAALNDSVPDDYDAIITLTSGRGSF